MYKPDNLEMLATFKVLNVELLIAGQPHKVVDIEMQTIHGPQSPPQTRPTIRLQIGDLETLIEHLTHALQIAKGTHIAPKGSTLQ